MLFSQKLFQRSDYKTLEFKYSMAQEKIEQLQKELNSIKLLKFLKVTQEGFPYFEGNPYFEAFRFKSSE